MEDNHKSDIKTELCKGIDVMAEKLNEIVQVDDPQVATGVSKFLRHFNKLSAPRSHSIKVSNCTPPVWVGAWKHNNNTGWPNKIWEKNCCPSYCCWSKTEERKERLGVKERKLLAVHLNA